MSLSEMFVAIQDTDTRRMCGTCNRIKPVEEFYKDGRDKDGKPRYRRDCKDCYKVTRMREAELKKRRKK